MAGECSDILMWWSVSFIAIYSSSLLFFIYLFYAVIPLGLGSGSNVSCEPPNFIGLELSKCRCPACYFYFSVVIRA